MPTLPELLDDAVGPVVPRLDTPDVRRRVGRRRRRRRVGVGAIVAVVLVAGIAAWPRPEHRRQVRTTEPGLFSSATGTVLVVDDGYDGVLLLDLDHGVAVRRVVDGQRAGDQDVRLSRSGDDLVVGWGDVHAAPLDGGPSTVLGTDVVSVPAAEPGTVWLYDLDAGAGPVRARRVDLHGRVLDELDVPGRPITGVRGGLLVRRTDDQVELVPEPSTPGLEGRVIGRGVTQVVAVSETLVAYCDGGDAFCGTVTVLDVATGRTFPVTLARAGEAIDVATAAFAPSSLQLAVRVGDRVVVYRPAGPPGLVAQLDLPAGSEHVSLAWGSEHDLYVLGPGDASNLLTRIDVRTGRSESVVVPLPISKGGQPSTLAEPRRDVAGLLDAPLVDERSCQLPAVQPSGRTQPCSFRF